MVSCGLSPGVYQSPAKSKQSNKNFPPGLIVIKFSIIRTNKHRTMGEHKFYRYVFSKRIGLDTRIRYFLLSNQIPVSMPSKKLPEPHNTPSQSIPSKSQTLFFNGVCRCVYSCIYIYIYIYTYVQRELSTRGFTDPHNFFQHMLNGYEFWSQHVRAAPV